MDKKKVDVYIDGRTYTIVGPKDEEYIIEMASYVDKKIRELTNKNDKLCQTMAATLAALNITDELHCSKSELIDLKEKSKDPIEKYNDLKEQVDYYKAKFKELEETCRDYKLRLEEVDTNRESYSKELDRSKDQLMIKEEELEQSQEIIKKLQDKVFNSQIQLAEAKKEILELNKALSKKRESKGNDD